MLLTFGAHNRATQHGGNLHIWTCFAGYLAMAASVCIPLLPSDALSRFPLHGLSYTYASMKVLACPASLLPLNGTQALIAVQGKAELTSHSSPCALQAPAWNPHA